MGVCVPFRDYMATPGLPESSLSQRFLRAAIDNCLTHTRSWNPGLNQLRMPAGALGDSFGPGTTLGVLSQPKSEPD